MIGIGIVATVLGLRMQLSAAPSSTTTSTTTFTAAMTTTAQTTITTTSTTSSSSSTTTTTPAETVAGFVDLYTSALASDDVDFLLSRLHPVVIDAYGPELCRTWIESEIVELESYELIGEVTGPTTTRVSIPEGSTDIADAYSARISFVFQGSKFEADAGFALVGTEIHWLGVCR